MKKRVGFLLTDPSETSSWYRAIGPFAWLERQGLIDIVIIDPRQAVRWPDLVRLDWLFVMRPHHASHYDIMDRALAFGIKTWVDLDDDILNLPDNHPNWDAWVPDSTREVVEECLKMATIVSVSTAQLAKAIFHLRSKVQVIPNAIDDFVWPNPAEIRAEVNTRTVTWRGGTSHEDDIGLVVADLKRCTEELDLKFLFMGYRPKCVYRTLEKGTFSHIPWTGHERVFEIMKKQRAHFHICPLENNALSRSKSNIAFLEAAWFGASLCMVSQVPGSEDHWKGAAIIPQGMGWFQAFHDFVSRPMDVVQWDLKTRNQKALQIIRENFLLSKVNELRKDILYGV